jgi:OmpA-OmpF porin, OOP family
MRKLILISTCFVFALALSGQTIDKKWNVGLHGGFTQYNGDLGNDFYKTNIVYGIGGISFSRYISEHFDLNMDIFKGTVGYNTADDYFNSDVTTASLNARFNVLGPKSFARPYIFLGGGIMLFDKELDISDEKIDYIAPSFGAGINFKLGPSVMFNINEAFLYTNGDERDGVVGGNNDMFLFHSIGLTFNFGHKDDEDGDGVSDFRDKCPNTPQGVSVDKKGCPLDRDGDGVADYLDACPDNAGEKALSGCPDKDGDGVADKDDECPDVKGLASLNGCPDKDGDGVADKDDRCPDVAGLIALKGCPDEDLDGVADIDDKCPNTKIGYVVDANGCAIDSDNDGLVDEEDECPDLPGSLALKGCPDTDMDGVSDKHDRCPTVKGTIENKGCPEMAVADVKKITQIASRIFFETNSDKLKVASLSQLDELTTILKKYDAANLTIEGHADSQGDDAYNLTLSQKRTEAVKTYLMSKGIMESRLQAIGYGETNPIASNNTADGRAKNRRVVLKTSF